MILDTALRILLQDEWLHIESVGAEHQNTNQSIRNLSADVLEENNFIHGFCNLKSA